MPSRKPPDGFEDLADHNLISYKSRHVPLDDWAIKELIGYYVNYRKEESAKFDRLLPESGFRLYGVSTRFPRKLNRQITLQRLKPGVYEHRRGTDTIRIIVLSEISEGKHNALWRLFSGKREAVLEAKQQYRIRQSDLSMIVQRLFEQYNREKFDMTYTKEDFKKDYVRDHLHMLPANEVLEQFSPDALLTRLSAKDRLQGLSADDILSHLSSTDLEELMKKLKKNLDSKT